MAQHYIAQLKERIEALKVRKCKGIPYKRIAGQNIFESDLYSKIYRPLDFAIYDIQRAKNAEQLYAATANFDRLRIKMMWETLSAKSGWMHIREPEHSSQCRTSFAFTTAFFWMTTMSV